MFLQMNRYNPSSLEQVTANWGSYDKFPTLTPNIFLMILNGGHYCYLDEKIESDSRLGRAAGAVISSWSQWIIVSILTWGMRMINFICNPSSWDPGEHQDSQCAWAECKIFINVTILWCNYWTNVTNYGIITFLCCN